MSYHRARTETPGKTHVTEDGIALKCGWGVSRFDADPPEPDWPVCKLCLKAVQADARRGKPGAAEFLAELESMPPNDTETLRMVITLIVPSETLKYAGAGCIKTGREIVRQTAEHAVEQVFAHQGVEVKVKVK